MHDSNCVKSQLSIMTANSRGATTLHINHVQIRAIARFVRGLAELPLPLSRGAAALPYRNIIDWPEGEARRIQLRK